MRESRQVKTLCVDSDVLASMFRRDDRTGTRVVIEGFPEDGVIVDAQMHLIYDRVILTVHSATFPIVPEGGEIPDLRLTVRSDPKPVRVPAES